MARHIPARPSAVLRPLISHRCKLALPSYLQEISTEHELAASQYHVLFLGISSLVWVPLASWMGKRPVLILATLLMTVCSMWCGFATSYDSLLAARILQAVGGGAADTVAPALVGDLFFVHQRGRAMVSVLSFAFHPLLGLALSIPGFIYCAAVHGSLFRRPGWRLHCFRPRMGIDLLGQHRYERVHFAGSYTLRTGNHVQQA